MKKEEVEVHVSMKKRFPDYPRLPKFILQRGMVGYVQPSQALQESYISGFTKRLNNWTKQAVAVGKIRITHYVPVEETLDGAIAQAREEGFQPLGSLEFRDTEVNMGS